MYTKALVLYPAHNKPPQKCYSPPYSFPRIMSFGEQLKKHKGFSVWKNEASEMNKNVVSRGEERRIVLGSPQKTTKIGWITVLGWGIRVSMGVVSKLTHHSSKLPGIQPLCKFSEKNHSSSTSHDLMNNFVH